MPKQSKKQKIIFSLSAPQAQAVLLAGTFTRWEQSPVALKKAKDGSWKTTVSLPPGSHEYRFIVDGQWQDDPACAERLENRFGSSNCVREVAEPATETRVPPIDADPKSR